MSTEKDTCQKSGTSVIFQKEITQCNCRIASDPDEALCKEAGNKLIEGMLRPYERVLIPDWCQLINKNE